jgi:hypothetical protein
MVIGSQPVGYRNRSCASNPQGAHCHDTHDTKSPCGNIAPIQDRHNVASWADGGGADHTDHGGLVMRAIMLTAVVAGCIGLSAGIWLKSTVLATAAAPVATPQTVMSPHDLMQTLTGNALAVEVAEAF